MKHGQIIDDDILDMFVKPMKKGVNVTVSSLFKAKYFECT